jgi:hypothetical protein
MTRLTSLTKQGVPIGDVTYKGADGSRVIGISGEVYGASTGPINVIAATQGFTGPFTDVGSEIDVRGYNCGAFFLNVDINDTENLRVKILGKHTSAGADEYSLDPFMWSLRDSNMCPTGGWKELNTDADGVYHIPFETDYAVPYLQLQIACNTAGASPGLLNSAVYTLGCK